MLITSLLLALSASAPCKAASGDAAAVLHRAADVLGMTRTSGHVLRVNATDIITHDYESDRTYSPYLLQASRFVEWFDAMTGADRITTSEGMIGGQQYGGSTTIGSRFASYGVRDTTLIPSAQLHSQLDATRTLNAWAVVADWLAAGDARVTQVCELRDYPRLVLTRNTDHGVESLYIDQKSGYPVSLGRKERSYLWGSSDVQYVFATWTVTSGVHVPGTATRVVDGSPEITRSFGRVDLVAVDSAPRMTMPPNVQPMQREVAAFLSPTAPDTIRVSDRTFLLRNPGYQEVVTLARDTVFVFDATQGEERARRDSAWIGKLFPGKHAIAVVVTDLAWPHVAGVRYWVAQGATIVSHRASQSFLARVVDRRWADNPDLLERARARGVKMKFRAVNDSLRLAAGDVTLFAIDGPSSEGALAAYVHGDHFLWASDFVQTLRAPTQYLDEVTAAVSRMGYTPSRLAAEHLPLSDWSAVERVGHQVGR
ncbi:MAG TPA: hypothetical protein VGM82_19950 [Gemmatimonadaceae bacterium]|jgi:hypothetical protein